MLTIHTYHTIPYHTVCPFSCFVFVSFQVCGPGLDGELVRSIGLNHSVEREVVSFQGCGAGINGLRLASQVETLVLVSRVSSYLLLSRVVNKMQDKYVHTFFLFSFFFNLTYSRWTSSLPSCLWSQRIFPSLPGSRLTIFYRDASSALLQLVNQWLNFTYSRSHAFRYERKNTNPTLVRIELTTSALAGVQVNY